MTKKTFSKVIAAVLVAAMCLTAVFTGAVSATSQTAQCTVVGRGYDAGNTDYLAADVTIKNATSDFVAGTFTVSCDEGLVFLDASAAQSNTGDLPEVYMNVSNNKVLFAGFKENNDSTINSFSELKLVLKFTVASGTIASLTSGSWNVSLSDIDITNYDEETYTVNGDNTASTAENAKIHIHSYGEPVTNNGVKTYTCSICGAVKKDITSATIGSNVFADEGIRSANVTFSSDGDTVLNALVKKSVVDEQIAAHGGTVYFTYTYKDDDPYPKTATSVASGTVEYNSVKYYVFPCGKNGGIGRMNRDIKGNYIHEWSDGSVTVSADWVYSIQKYAAALVGSSDAKIANYAKALWNYGYYTTVQLNNNAEDIASYNDNGGNPVTYGVGDFTTSYGLPTSSKVGRVNKDGVLDSSWKLISASVTTGFRPKMKIVFNPGEYTKLTIQVKDDGDLVYSKEVVISNLADSGDNKVYEISDIPTKYLIDDIIIGVKNNSDVESTTSFKYGFGRYAKARATQSDANVFNSMMQYSYHLNQKYARN